MPDKERNGVSISQDEECTVVRKKRNPLAHAERQRPPDTASHFQQTAMCRPRTLAPAFQHSYKILVRDVDQDVHRLGSVQEVCGLDGQRFVRRTYGETP